MIFIRDNKSSLGALIRKKIYKTKCYIDSNVVIYNKNNFQADEGSSIYYSSYILNNNGHFFLGKNSHLGAFCYINVCYGQVVLREDVAIGPGTKIIAYSNYYRFGKKVTVEKITQNVQIGNNVFIGANCTILPGTTINDNVVIGAGSIVKGELESNSIYVGVPCKKIKSGWYA